MINVSIIGGTGYVAAELIRILLKHPYVNIKYVMSSSNANTDISETYKHFKKKINLSYTELNYDLLKDSDVIFCCLPHGISQDIVYNLHHMNKLVIDLSADYRYKDINIYNEWYGSHKYPDLFKEAVYGLPELYRNQIKKSKIIGNPGCYTTCSILSLAPLLKNKMIEKNNIIIDAKSGVSGAGRKSDFNFSFCETDENFKAYSIASHRHTSEIEQEYSILYGNDIKITFTPHLLPIKRGILCTIYANLVNKSIAIDAIREIYLTFYENEYFVRIYNKGEFPEIKYVTGSNFIDIGFAIDKRTNRIIIVSAIDNLIKGAAGQAVQNMNILLNLDEKTGLDFTGEYF